jgi:hypothetical protein
MKMIKLVIKSVLVLFAIILVVLGFFLFRNSLAKMAITRTLNQKTEFVFAIGSIHLNRHSIVINELSFKHKLEREAFFKEKGFETDWVNAEVKQVMLDSISWVDIIKGHYVIALCDIDGAKLNLFRDKRFPNKYKYKPMLSALLRNVKKEFTVECINIRNSKVIIEEINKKTEEHMVLTINRLNGKIQHISSDSFYINQHPKVLINASAFILDSIETHMTYASATMDKDDVFTLKGFIKSFDATHLNKCIEPAAKAKVTSGFINEIKFDITGNEHQSTGTLDMNYEHLKIAFEEEVKNRNVKTVLANMFIKNNNEDAHDSNKHRTGEVKFERRKDRFIFNYWWNSLKSGLMSSVLNNTAQKLIEKKTEASKKEDKPNKKQQRKKNRK